MLKTEFKHTGRVYKVQTFGTLQGKKKTEHQLRKPKDSGQRRLDDF